MKNYNRKQMLANLVKMYIEEILQSPHNEVVSINIPGKVSNVFIDHNQRVREFERKFWDLC